MEWLTCIRKAIDYMEEHLEDNISAQDVAGQIFMSSFFFQKWVTFYAYMAQEQEASMNKEWSELNKTMQTELKKRGTFNQGIFSLMKLRDELWNTILSLKN